MALKVAQRTLQKMLAFHLRFACNSSAFCLQFICVLLAIHLCFACNSSAFCVQFIREKRAIFHIVCTFWVQKNAAVKNCCAILVIPLRFERRTHALEGRCSIQLSYGTSLKKLGAKVRFFFLSTKYSVQFLHLFPLNVDFKG